MATVEDIESHSLQPALVLTSRTRLSLPEGDWSALGERAASALAADYIDIAGEVSGDTPTDAVITYPDGSTSSVPVPSLRELKGILETRRQPCDRCTPIVTSPTATLTTMPLDTAHGTVIVPAWRLAVQGTEVHLLRAAVGVSFITMPASLTTPPQLQPLDGWSVANDGRTLTIHVAEPTPDRHPCDGDFAPMVAESEHAVAITVWTTTAAGSASPGCDARTADGSITVTLDRPLGHRAVIDAATRTGLGSMDRSR